MSDLQWYVYLSGFVALFVGCFFYYQSRKENLSEQQKKIKTIGMYLFSVIAFICVVYSWL